MDVQVNVSLGAHSELQDTWKPSKCNVDKSLADYVRREYPALTKQEPGFYSVPSELPEPDDHDKGGLAEYAVYNRLKDYSESLGLSMILFCESAYAGRKSEDGGYLPKEVDFVVFLSDKNRCKAFVLEVKGSDAKVKKLSTTRRHGCSQLQNPAFKASLGQNQRTCCLAKSSEYRIL